MAESVVRIIPVSMVSDLEAAILKNLGAGAPKHYKG